MTLYRKKPVEVEARQFQGKGYGADADLAEWASAYYDDDGDGRPGYLIIQTLEGPMRAQRGDWIIKGVQGEFYPCKPDIFAATYAPVTAAEETAVMVPAKLVRELAEDLEKTHPFSAQLLRNCL